MASLAKLKAAVIGSVSGIELFQVKTDEELSKVPDGPVGMIVYDNYILWYNTRERRTGLRGRKKKYEKPTN